VDQREHWDAVYAARRPDEVSWYQTEARLSLALIRDAAPDLSSRILDVGGGASTLVDGLLSAGYEHVTVLDLSPIALRHAQQRLGAAAARVAWVEADILVADLPRDGYDLWHDRALFHFLTEAADRRRYVAQVRQSVRAGGHLLVATFAEDGPVRCSGLMTKRYTPEALHAEFGDGFQLLESRREVHVTPSGSPQAFVYCLCSVT